MLWWWCCCCAAAATTAAAANACKHIAGAHDVCNVCDIFGGFPETRDAGWLSERFEDPDDAKGGDVPAIWR